MLLKNIKPLKFPIPLMLNGESIKQNKWMDRLSNKWLLGTARQHEIYFLNLFNETPANVLGWPHLPFCGTPLVGKRYVRETQKQTTLAKTDLLFSVIKHFKKGGVETSSNYGI